jgi:hypothetical protein
MAEDNEGVARWFVTGVAITTDTPDMLALHVSSLNS